VYEARDENSAFDPALWSASNQVVIYRPACKTGVPGNQTCEGSNRAAYDPRFPFSPTNSLNPALIGTVVPGVGSLANGQWANGMAHHPTNPDSGKKDGWYYDYPMWSYAPRVGLAWDVFGDGKTAIRASTGVFYNFVNRNTYGFSGGALVSRNRTISNSTLNELATAVATGNFVESPQGTRIPPGFGLERSLHGNQLPQGELEPERNYHVNVAFQRDIGFNTVAEVAYVSNIGRKQARSKTINNIPINAYALPENLFSTEAIAENFLRRDYPGVGSISYLTTDDDILNYNAMQVSVQRRLSKGLQMGLAYTLSKSEGMQGWDFMTEELYGKQGLRDRYYGPPAGNPVGVQDGRQDRRHVVVVNYSYMIPNPTPNVTILKHVLRDWEASGVSTFMTGSNVNPNCNEDPTLTGAPIRCELVPGADVNDPGVDGRPEHARRVPSALQPERVPSPAAEWPHGQHRQLGPG
jgi:hypothetical protein